jgi:hypothetical protein
MRVFSSWGERGGDSTREPVPPLSFKEFVFETMESGVEKNPPRDMVDGLSFSID